MNRHQAKGKWNQIKGMAKKAWGRLTEDDLKKAEGSMDKLYGVIQEKVGDTKKAIEAKLGKFHLKLSRTHKAKAARRRNAMRSDFGPFFKLRKRGKAAVASR